MTLSWPGARAAWRRPNVHPFAVGAVHAQDLDRLVVRRPEPVRQTGVELSDLAWPHGDVVLTEDQAHLARIGRRAIRSRRACEASRSRSGGMTTFQTASPLDCWVRGKTRRPLRVRGLKRIRGSPTSGAPTSSSSGTWYASASGSSSSRLGFRCPLSRRDSVLFEMPVLGGDGGQSEAPAGAQPLQARPDLGENVRDRRRVLHTFTLLSVPGNSNESGAARFAPAASQSMDRARYDVVVVGGGAAGLSAALVLGRARRRVAVVDAGAPRNAPASHMHGFLSRDGMSPAELLVAGRAEAAAYGVEFISGHVVSVEPGFAVSLDDGETLAARRLLIATGATDELPPIPGLQRALGPRLPPLPLLPRLGSARSAARGARHRPGLGRARATHPPVVGRSHLLRAQLRADGCRSASSFKLAAFALSTVEVRGIVVEDDRLRGVVLGDGRTVERAALFIRPLIRARPDGLLGRLGCELDDLGFARVDSEGRTSLPGVWAAGNAANPRAQVITAAGEGSAAAISINADLVQEDIEHALRAAAESSRQ